MSSDKNTNTKNITINSLSEKDSLLRIEEKFKEYWKCLLYIISFYFFCYIIWFDFVLKFIKIDKDINKEWLYVLLVSAVVGMIYSLDGYVTSLLKSPFNQMCFTVNTSRIISNKDKDLIVNRATRSSENCKETLKKFGSTTLSAQAFEVFIRGVDLRQKGFENYGKYHRLIYISFTIPLIFVLYDILSIDRKIRNLKKLNGGKN